MRQHRASGWLGEEDSNPRYVVQSHASYHSTIPHQRIQPYHTPIPPQRMAVLSARLGRKRGTLVVGIWISLPVRGLRPLRAARRATTNVPNPEMVTRRPLRSDSTMLPTNAFMARSADVF